MGLFDKIFGNKNAPAKPQAAPATYTYPTPSQDPPQQSTPPAPTPPQDERVYTTPNERIRLTPKDVSFGEAVRIYVSTDHMSCPSKYHFDSYFSAAFESILLNLPKHQIALSDERVLRQNQIENPIEDSKNITRASSIAKIKDFVAIDTETTGLKPGGNDIIEICAIKFIDFAPVSIFHTYLKPRKSIPPDATAVNHITDDMVKDAPTFAQIRNDLQAFIGNLPLVAHNAMFDMRFLHVSGLNLEKHTGKIYDTLKLSRLKLRDYEGEKFENYKLVTVCEEQNISCSNFHSASSDTLACGLVFIDIVREVFETEDVKTLIIEKAAKPKSTPKAKTTPKKPESPQEIIDRIISGYKMIAFDAVCKQEDGADFMRLHIYNANNQKLAVLKIMKSDLSMQLRKFTNGIPTVHPVQTVDDVMEILQA